MKGRIVAAGALVLALAAFGCGDNSGNPVGFEPEGVGVSGFLLLDVQPANTDSSEVVVYGDIYDGSTANGYRLYVDPGGTGFRPATDYIAAPTHTFSTGMNNYRIRSLTWDPTVDNIFVGRGSRNGIESAAALKTEKATVPTSPFPLAFARRVDVPLVSPADSAMVDSLPTLSWSAVPGATRYRLQIEGRNGVVYSVLLDTTTHTVGGPAGMTIENLPMRGGFLYRWSVDAIDGLNRIIGTTQVRRALLVE
jgi:hypothetical protein